MKRNKLIVFAVAVLVALALTLTLAACDNAIGFEIKLDYDPEQGSVTVSQPAVGDKYQKGETVTVEVTPNVNYEVAEFSVTGFEYAALKDGKYSFAIVDDVTIKVEFASKFKGEYHSVSVTSDEHSKFKLNPASSDGKYADGTKVTLSVTPDSGYKAEVSVNSEPVKLVRSSYEFEVNADVQIVVTSKRTIPEAVLNSLRGNVKFEGTDTQIYLVNGDDGLVSDGDPIISHVVTQFDDDRNLIMQYEVDEHDGTIYSYFLVGLGSGGNAYAPVHYLDGSVRWEVPIVTDAYGNQYQLNEKYDDLANVFAKLSPQDLSEVEENIYTIDDPELALEMAYALTGYNYGGIVDLRITAENGVAVKIEFSTPISYMEGYTLYDDVEFDVTQGVSLPEYVDKPYPAQTELENALNAAAQAASYKSAHNSDSYNYNSYFVRDAGDGLGAVVWIEQNEFSNSFGYIARPDGNAYAFRFANGGIEFNESPTASDMAELYASFDLLGEVSTSMFVKNEDGKYVLRDEDLSGTYAEMLLYYCAQSFSTGVYEFNEFAYATQIAISLTDGKLDKVELTIPGEEDDYVVTLTFSDFGTATLPDGVNLESSDLDGIFTTDYLGTWLDDDNGIRVDIALDSMSLNGVKALGLGKQEGKFVATVDGTSYTLYLEDGKLKLVSQGHEYTLRHRDCAWENMFGTYKSQDGSLTIEISAEGFQLTIGTDTGFMEAEYFEFDETDGLGVISFTINDPDYGYVEAYISLLAKNKAVNFLIIYDEETAESVNAYADGYDFFDWTDFVGEYSDGKNSLKIEADKITLNYDGQELVFEKADILYEAVENVVPIFTMIKNGWEYTLQQYGSTFCKLSLYTYDQSSSVAEHRLQTTFIRNDYEDNRLSWEKFEDKYFGTDEDGVAYEVRVTAEGLVVLKDGTQQTISDVDFDRYYYTDQSTGDKYWLYRFNFTMEDIAYRILQAAEDDYTLFYLQEEVPNTSAVLRLCVLGRDRYAHLDDWSDHVGTYEGMDYTIEITQDAINVTIGGVKKAATEIDFFSNYDYDFEMTYYGFTFKLDNEEYALKLAEKAALLTLPSGGKYVLVASDYALETDYTDWYGYYASSDKQVVIQIVEDDGVYFTKDGGGLQKVDVTYFGDLGMAFEFDGKQYVLSLTIETVSIYKDHIDVTEDGKLFASAEEGDPPIETDWTMFNGTWHGSSYDYVYDVVINNGTITLSRDGGAAVTATQVSVSYDNTWHEYSIEFSINGKIYHLVIAENDMNSASLTSVGEGNANMKKQAA